MACIFFAAEEATEDSGQDKTTHWRGRDQYSRRSTKK